MQKLLVLCALEQELPPDQNPYSDITIYTGVGKVNAAMHTCLAIEKFNPDTIINVGTAGSCNNSLAGLIECGNFIDRDDSGAFNTDTIITTDYKKCVISTGDNFTTKELNFCDLVDMESYAIAKVCSQKDVNFICYKYITDYVGSNSVSMWEENCHKGAKFFVEKIDDHFKNTI